MMAGFELCKIQSGLIFSREIFPTRIYGFNPGDETTLETQGSIFGYVQSGEAEVTSHSGTHRHSFTLHEGMYFSVNSTIQLKSRGQGILIANEHHRCLATWGGPIEAHGRLRYIDGCTDSLLLSPTLQGDPCLNLLVFPPDIRQTPHTHPSFRAGVIARGSGYCVMKNEKVRLTPGMAWIIDAEIEHCFHSDAGGLSVIAYHPDSDWGPTHETHPMINRTIISRT